MTKSEKRADFTKMVLQLLAFAVPRASYHGVLLYLKEVERHKCAQQLNVNEGVSWTFNSLHLRGLASDFVVISGDSRQALWNHPLFDEMGEFWISIGGEWGGELSWIEKGHEDRPHFQYNAKRRGKYLEENQDS